MTNYEQMRQMPFIGPLIEGIEHRFNDDGVCVLCLRQLEEILESDNPHDCLSCIPQFDSQQIEIASGAISNSRTIGIAVDAQAHIITSGQRITVCKCD